MLKLILILVVLAVGTVLVLAALKPDTFKVQRSLVIAAPAEKIYPLIDKLSDQARWQPYYQKDPAMKVNYSGPEAGPGAQVEFAGNRQVGSGRITITGHEEPGKVSMRLEMLKPFAADNQIEFTLVPKDQGTEVTWTMQGHTPYPAKIIHVLFNMDKMVGGDFEIGLSKLKAIAEGTQA